VEALLRARPGPFYVRDIAQALALRPGRAEIDRDEARRIADSMFGAFERGEFGETEVVVRYGDPPRFGTIRQAMDEASGGGYQWIDIDPNLWFAAVALTYAAAKRYVESGGLAGAARVLREWFPDAQPLAITEFVGQYVADEKAAGCQATKKGLEGAWRNAGKKGHRDQLRVEFDKVMGDDAPIRGRPMKSPKINREK